MNCRANRDLAQLGILTDGDEPMWYANDDNSRFYYLASQYYWDGASLTYVDAAFADVQARGALYVAGYQYHLGDTDTYWLYETDEMTQVVGGVEMWNYVEVAGQDYAEFNSAEADVDFIVNTTVADTIFAEGATGRVAIGHSTPDVLCHIEQDIATTDAVQRIFRIAESCSGTVGDGFGVGMQFELESASQASMEIAGAIDVLWEDEDTGDSDMVISLQDGWTLGERLRISSTGWLRFMVDSADIDWSPDQITAFSSVAVPVVDGVFGAEGVVSGSTGGLQLRGFTKAAAGGAMGIELRAYTENDPTDEGAIHLRTFKHDGAGALAVIGDAGHVLAVENNTTQILTLHGNGALDLTHLAGTGVRNVVADANGQLSAQSGLMFSQTASVTIASETNPTTLTGAGVGSLTLPADFFVAGKTLMIEAWGYYGTKAPAAAYINILFKLAGNTICSTGTTPDMGTTESSQFWKTEIVVTCRTIGATGTVFAQGGFRHNETAPAEEYHNHAMQNTGTDTIDTTGTLAVDLVADWEVADAANTITCTNLIVNALN